MNLFHRLQSLVDLMAIKIVQCFFSANEADFLKNWLYATEKSEISYLHT